MKFTKKRYAFLATTVLAIIGFVWVLLPVVNRLQDVSEREKVDATFIALTKDLQLLRGTDERRVFAFEEVQLVLQNNDALKGRLHPQTDAPYVLKVMSSEYYIDGPDNRKFINYDAFDGVSFYYGTGSCGDPAASASFIAYVFKMKRVHESGGFCTEI